MKAYEVPELSRTARGTPIINLIQIEQGEFIEAVIPVREFSRTVTFSSVPNSAWSKRLPWKSSVIFDGTACSPSICGKGMNWWVSV